MNFKGDMGEVEVGREGGRWGEGVGEEGGGGGEGLLASKQEWQYTAVHAELHLQFSQPT